MRKKHILLLFYGWLLVCQFSLAEPVKNIILLIGDGMGPQEMGFLLSYAHKAPHSIYRGQKTGLEKWMAAGQTTLSLTHPANALVVDSACSATQLATGVACNSEMIGLDASGNPAQTILEKAQTLEKATGLVSDTRITHATPAAFAAHQAHRNSENEIAEDLLAHEVDVMLSGGLRHFLPQPVNQQKDPYSKWVNLTGGGIKISSKRKDDKDLLEQAKQQGYSLAFNLKQMQKVSSGKLLGLFSESGMPDGIEYSQSKNDPKRTIPSLKEMALKALEILSQSEKGFFLMVEGGQIDWAAHQNDAGTLLHELIKFDEALSAIYEWVKTRNDTVVILTADHETGGFGFSYSRKNIPQPISLPGSAFANHSYQPEFNFGEFSLLDKIFQQQKSFEDLFAEWDALPKEKQTVFSLMQVVNQNSAFQITESDVAEILAVEPNDYYCPGHTFLGVKEFPKIKDFKEFYVYGKEERTALLGRVLAKDQNIVWSTGTHTCTPVTVTVCKPADLKENLSGVVHHTDVGKFMFSILNPNLASPTGFEPVLLP